MCATEERNSTICGHRASFIHKCKKKVSVGGSILNRFAKECPPALNSTYHYEICNECRRFWLDHGVSEHEATERKRDYRKKKDNYAPLVPETVFYHQGTGTWAAIVPDLAMFYREVNASVETLWPSLVDPLESNPEVLPTLPAKSYMPPTTADSNRTGFETITVGISSDLVNPRDFELRNVNKTLQPGPKNEGSERPIKQFPTSSQLQPSNWRIEPDLDKPLPRRPRPDSPMPGRPFDSQNPERDLPANKYYPRFI